MSLVIDQPHLVDTLRFQLYAARALPQEDIRLTVAVTAFVPPSDNDRDGLERRIRAALARVADVPWTFSRIGRQEEAAGYERVSLRAAARLPAVENWNLTERLRNASGEGIEIAQPEVSYALTAGKVDAAVAALRLELLEKATKQAEAFSCASGRAWRIGDMEFGASSLSREGGRRTGKGAYSDDSDAIEAPGIAESTGAVRSGERITLIAAVVLKAAA